ncbi:MAG: hypothetical protein P8Z49_06820 [Acidobacteriota bacterium]
MNLVLIVVMAALVFLVPETYETPPAPSYTSLDKALPVSRSKVIPYDILREQIVGPVLSVEILVDDTATKDQVLALAQELGRSYLADESIRRAFVFIYDSREAQERRMDESYPRSDFLSHYLAAVSIDKDTGENTIRWTAEGRGH